MKFIIRNADALIWIGTVACLTPSLVLAFVMVPPSGWGLIQAILGVIVWLAFLLRPGGETPVGTTNTPRRLLDLHSGATRLRGGHTLH